MATVAPDVPVLARDEAFEKLYRRYVKDVYHYALALLRNPADAEDVTQTTFLNAYRAYRRGDEILKPQNWLIKIAHNVARSRYSSMTRRVKEVPLEEHVERLAVSEDERPNVEGVLRALGRLPFNQRGALIMRELEGRSYVEIADTLGVSVAAVETLIFRARRSLRVRSAALRSILGVPVPSSLAQVFEGGGVAAVGGVGTGVVVKTVAALVAGAVATGIGGDHGTRAVAAPAAKPAGAPIQSIAKTRPTPPKAAPGPLVAATRSSQVPAGARTTGRGHVSRPAPADPASQAATGTSHSQPAPAAPSPLASVQSPVSAAVTVTANTVVGTVEQTVSTATTAPSVAVPELPVQPPSLPRLP
jgi:RNA polymerase sigma factor (sigma-70 family)